MNGYQVELPSDATIFQRLIGAGKAIPSIGKDTENKDQHYVFRGIEKIKMTVRTHLLGFGVFYVPEVVNAIHTEYTTGRGTVMQHAFLTVKYTLYGLLGDSVSAVLEGEASDSSDKASNKALSATEKYMLLQVLQIADSQTDGDRETPDGPSQTGERSTGQTSVRTIQEGRKRATRSIGPQPWGSNHKTVQTALFGLCVDNHLNAPSEVESVIDAKIRNTNDLSDEDATIVFDDLVGRGYNFKAGGAKLVKTGEHITTGSYPDNDQF